MTRDINYMRMNVLNMDFKGKLYVTYPFRSFVEGVLPNYTKQPFKVDVAQ